MSGNYPDGVNQDTFDRAWNELSDPPEDEMEIEVELEDDEDEE